MNATQHQEGVSNWAREDRGGPLNVYMCVVIINIDMNLKKLTVRRMQIQTRIRIPTILLTTSSIIILILTPLSFQNPLHLSIIIRLHIELVVIRCHGRPASYGPTPSPAPASGSSTFYSSTQDGAWQRECWLYQATPCRRILLKIWELIWQELIWVTVVSW